MYRLIIRSLAFRVVNDLMLKSPATMISATAVTALWSAGRGMFSVARGLNRVNGKGRRHWYVFNRLIYCGYTILFIAVCIMSMGLLVFGRTLQSFIQSHFPLIAPITGYVIQMRQLWGLAMLLVFFLGSTAWSRTGKRTSKLLCRGCIFHSWLDAFFSCIFHVFQFYRWEKLFLYVWQSCSYRVVIFVVLYLYMHTVYGSGN